MNYTNDFEKWWQVFCQTSPSSKGSKYQAFEIWNQLKAKNELPSVEVLIQGVYGHKNNDRYFKNKNQFVPCWQHGCRWLKNRGWEAQDESALERQQKIRVRQKELERARQEYIKMYGAWIMETDPVILIEKCKRDPRMLYAVKQLRPDIGLPEVKYDEQTNS